MYEFPSLLSLSLSLLFLSENIKLKRFCASLLTTENAIVCIEILYLVYFRILVSPHHHDPVSLADIYSKQTEPHHDDEHFYLIMVGLMEFMLLHNGPKSTHLCLDLILGKMLEIKWANKIRDIKYHTQIHAKTE